jgi:hypothetical protein
MLLQALYSVVVGFQFRFGKYGMYLIVAYLMQQDGGGILAPFAEGYQVMFGAWLCQFTFAEGA